MNVIHERYSGNLTSDNNYHFNRKISTKEGLKVITKPKSESTAVILKLLAILLMVISNLPVLHYIYAIQIH